MLPAFASIHTVQIKCKDPSKQYRIGGLSNEHGKKGIEWQSKNFACTPRSFVHFFTATARLQRESA